MMRRRRWMTAVGGFMLGATGVMAAVPAAAPGVLASLEAGQWELVERGDTPSRRLVCIGNRTQLIQIRHAGVVCRQQLMTDDMQETTVHYLCPGTGEGHTTIRAVTPRSAVIETQGLVNGVPFQLNVEARRIGACPVPKRGR
ncbi:hypothetical protein NYR55_12030 [Sphingomonas sp. BGYR3]|uniref:hypothetical protein n=1 Tax=Sphingomonas sp. BGYR3 TaxID=2975483 RepID=UPI0021A30211|nr:hypothetical protein [Sphingomonas sp. BGYR3]MDG5489344.1 hypothetical protein [Sphingomonas sp. BGYR3]